MAYVTDAAREYAKNHAKDGEYEDRLKELFESFAAMINAFDKEHHDKLAELLETTKIPSAGPTVGSKLASEYFDLFF